MNKITHYPHNKCQSFLSWKIGIGILVMSMSMGRAQTPDYAIMDINQLGLTVWNNGMLGNQWQLLEGQIEPSCQYQLNPELLTNQIEHFSHAGVWIGGIVNGQHRVSTSIIDGVYEQGQEGIEFAGNSDILIRSADMSSPYYHPSAVADREFISTYDDTADVYNHTPLGVSVRQKVFAWNNPALDGSVIIEYSIENIGQETLHDVYLGLWVDPAVANMNYTSIYETGGGFTWYDNLDGFDQTLNTNGYPRNVGYQYDEDGDDGWAESYVGISPLGSDVPRNSWEGHYAQWIWSLIFNTDYPSYTMALTDDDRYGQMQTNVPQGDPTDPNYTAAGYPSDPNTWMFLVSAGPFGSVENASGSTIWSLPPGDSIRVAFALGCAFWDLADRPNDSALRRRNLSTTIDWAQTVFNGEDFDGNGILDPDEDQDSDGVIDRYITPPFPPQQLSASWNYPNVELTWDTPDEPVEGYHVYRSQNDEPYTLLTDPMLSTNTFSDPSVPDSGITSYYITSVNAWNMESAPSNEIRDYSLPPTVSFVYKSNPINTPNDTVYTFTTRTFFWEISDPDGNETISQVYYTLDDTSSWIELPADQRAITMENIPAGDHVFYVKAEDNFALESPVIQFPDTSLYTTPKYWQVVEPVGDVLLIDDYVLDQPNGALHWYQSILDSLVGPDQYSTWEIGEELPYSEIDLRSNLSFFNRAIWFTAYTGHETYDEAEQAIYSYVMNGGNVFMIVPELQASSFLWFPIDTTVVLNPSGRLFPGVNIESQIDSSLDLTISSLIAIRVKGFEVDLEDGDTCPRYKSLYKMPPPGTGDGWTGTPTVGGMVQFEAEQGECSGKVVLLSLPLHNGSSSLMQNDGTVSGFFNYVLNEEFLSVEGVHQPGIVQEFRLQPNYPNPFNATTVLTYDLPRKEHVKLTIHDLLGREMVVLVDEIQSAGTKQIRWNAGRKPSGIYFYRLEVDDQVHTGEMILLK